ncbi:MAG: Tol-Pal system protein TolB [Alphaproteobacteria bacterium]|nr:Tol-Pal system protein TolB [Alphaproteobacteria bacterium]
MAIAATPALAQRGPLRIDITRGNVDPLPIAVTDLYSDSLDGTRVGANITRVVAADLARSGLFRPLPAQTFLQRPQDMTLRPRFADWRVITAQCLVTGRASVEQDGRLRVEFRLWDVFAEQQMSGLVYTSTPDAWRRIAHKMADEIYERVTGESGYFDTRIVYVSESGNARNRIKRLAIMDQDGEGHKFLTDGSNLVLTPRFSPTAQEITYLAYVNERPRVYIYNIDTGQQEVLGDFPGMTFAPRFSPDGRRVIMSLAQSGNTDIYTMDLQTRERRQLTNSPAIETSPSYSPDGRQVTFNSDRSGGQQLYVMNGDGGDARRISFANNSARYGTPVWSPRGDLIAFTKIDQGTFYIGVMRPDGSGERLLTESFLVEGPTWAPNGRVLMFYRQGRMNDDGTGGEAQLWSIDLTGQNERLVVTPALGSDPAWSPLLTP